MIQKEIIIKRKSELVNADFWCNSAGTVAIIS